MPKRLMRTLPCTLFILTILPLLAVSNAAGADEETGGLGQQIEALRQRVERLDARVRELERCLSDRGGQRLQDLRITGANSSPSGEREHPGPAAERPAEPHPAESPSAVGIEKSPIPQRWRKLERGMTAEAVEALLGLPQRVMEVDSKIVWYYRYPNFGAGSVLFAPDKRVTGWQKPPFHGWW